MKKEMRKCEKCGKKFAAKAVNQKYCSLKCKNLVKREVEKSRKAKKAVVKATTKKPVKLAEKVKLPKKPTEKNVVHNVKPNDIIRFDKSFTPERVLCYAMRLEMLALKEIVSRTNKKGKAK